MNLQTLSNFAGNPQKTLAIIKNRLTKNGRLLPKSRFKRENHALWNQKHSPFAENFFGGKVA